MEGLSPRQGLRGLAYGLRLELLSAVLLALSFPNPLHHGFFPLGGWIAFIALVPLLSGIHGVGVFSAFRRGYVTGAVFFTVSLAWITEIRPMGPGAFPAWLALSAYLALYPACFAAGVAWGRGKGWPAEALWIPAWWTLLEWARELVLTGYPWLTLGSSQAFNDVLLPALRVGGVYALHFTVVFVNLALWRAWTTKGRGLGLSYAASAALACGLVLAGALQAPLASAGRVRVAVLQGNIDQDEAWTDAYRHEVFSVYGRLSAQAVSSGARVIVWPESTFPGFFNRLPEAAEALSNFSRVNKVDLMFGSTLEEAEGYTNAIVHLRPQGGPEAYRKRRLVPFGEYVPLRRAVGALHHALARLGVVDFVPGSRDQKVFGLGAVAGQAAPLLCYESLWGSLAADPRPDPGLYVVATLDTWFGDTAAPAYHAQHAVLRAVESGRWVARAAATGISLFASPDGRVTQNLPLNVEGFLVQDVELKQGSTFYQRNGPWFVWLCAWLLAAVAVWPKFKNTKNP